MRHSEIRIKGEIRLSEFLFYFVFLGLLIASLIVGIVHAAIFIESVAYKIVSISSCLIVILLVLRFFLIGVILLYKIVAPTSVREQCRFEPTCSIYMILALRKYGLIKGLAKGINRIKRCRPPNGGIDYPWYLNREKEFYEGKRKNCYTFMS